MTFIDVFLACSKYGLEIRDFGPSFRDGHAFNAMIHNIDDHLVDLDLLPRRTNRENLESAFVTAQDQLGIPALLDAAGKSRSCHDVIVLNERVVVTSYFVFQMLMLTNRTRSR